MLSFLPPSAHVQAWPLHEPSTGLHRAWLLREQPIGSEPLTTDGCPVLSFMKLAAAPESLIGRPAMHCLHRQVLLCTLPTKSFNATHTPSTNQRT